VALVRELQARGTPVSGLGIQAHEPREEWYPPKAVWETLETLAATGPPLHATELHPQSSDKPITGDWRNGTWTEDAQADFTEQLVRLLFGHPAVVSINQTDASGAVSFRGYFGEYDLLITPAEGRARKIPVSVRSDEENRWTFTVGK
jgi:hypothetical protein